MPSTKLNWNHQRFLYVIAAPIIAAVAATALVITLMLVWSANHANEAAFDRQENLAALVLGQSIDRIPDDQESTTVWDDPVTQAAGAHPRPAMARREHGRLAV